LSRLPEPSGGGGRKHVSRSPPAIVSFSRKDNLLRRFGGEREAVNPQLAQYCAAKENQRAKQRQLSDHSQLSDLSQLAKQRQLATQVDMAKHADGSELKKKSLESSPCVEVTDDDVSPGLMEYGESQIQCVTDWADSDTLRWLWRIKDFSNLRRMARERAPSPSGGVVVSPKHVDRGGSCWWLRLYPWESRTEHQSKVSLFVHTDRPKKEDVQFSVTMAIVDLDGQEIDGTQGHVPHVFFPKGESARNFGFFDFVRDEELVKRCLHDEDALMIVCNVRIFGGLQTYVATHGPSEKN